MDNTTLMVLSALVGGFVGCTVTLLFRATIRLFEIKLVLERIDTHIRQLGGRDEVGRLKVGEGGPWG